MMHLIQTNHDDCEARHARHREELETVKRFPRTLQEAFPESEGYADVLHQVHKPLFRLDRPVLVTMTLLVLVVVVAMWCAP